MDIQVVQSSETLQIDTSDYNTKFLIYRASRAHTGVYTITAKNSQGEDSATVEIKILGKDQFDFIRFISTRIWWSSLIQSIELLSMIWR